MSDLPLSSQKQCADCGELKELEAFPRAPRRPDGRGAYCKVCYSMRYRLYRKRKAAREGRQFREQRDVPDGMHYCPKCEQVKAREEFPRNRSAKNGLANYCKPCHNKESKAACERTHGSTREYHLRRRYGIGVADVDAMIEAQGGTCATCEGKPEHVDHDHATGKVRGVLCFNCNQALGNVRDNAATLTRLHLYLRRHQPAADKALPLSPFEIDLRDYFERHRAG